MTWRLLHPRFDCARPRHGFPETPGTQVASERGITDDADARTRVDGRVHIYTGVKKKSPWLGLYVICISLARALATHTWITLEIDTIFLPAVHPSLLPSVYHVSWMKIRSIRTLSRGGEECSSTPFRRGSNGRGGGCSTLILLLACNSRPCGFMFDCLGAKVHARF